MPVLTLLLGISAIHRRTDYRGYLDSQSVPSADVEPEIHDFVGVQIVGIQRIEKRIVWELENDHFWVFHLMIADRFQWKKTGSKPTRKVDLAAV